MDKLRDQVIKYANINPLIYILETKLLELRLNRSTRS